MDSVWEFSVRHLDWEGYTKDHMVWSLHRTQEGAEKARDKWAEEYPTTAASENCRLDVHEVEVMD